MRDEQEGDFCRAARQPIGDAATRQARAFIEGRDAGRAGYGMAENVYSNLNQPTMHAAWRRGWSDGARERATDKDRPFPAHTHASRIFDADQAREAERDP
jgi:hypothetical protein